MNLRENGKMVTFLQYQVCIQAHITSSGLFLSRGQPHPKYKATFKGATRHIEKRTAEEHRQCREVHTVNEQFRGVWERAKNIHV